jgi:hypothetical protein
VRKLVAADSATHVAADAVQTSRCAASTHAKQMKLYDIGPEGIVMGEALTGYRGLLTGAPRRTSGSRRGWINA